MSKANYMRAIAATLSLILAVVLLDNGAGGWALFLAFVSGMWTSAFFRRVADMIGIDLSDKD